MPVFSKIKLALVKPSFQKNIGVKATFLEKNALKFRSENEKFSKKIQNFFLSRIRLQTFSIFILSFFFKLRILLFSPLAIWLALQVPPLPLSLSPAWPPTLTPSLFSLVKETLPSDLSSCIPQRKSKLRIRDRREETRVQKRERGFAG